MSRNGRQHLQLVLRRQRLRPAPGRPLHGGAEGDDYEAAHGADPVPRRRGGALVGGPAGCGGRFAWGSARFAGGGARVAPGDLGPPPAAGPPPRRRPPPGPAPPVAAVALQGVDLTPEVLFARSLPAVVRINVHDVAMKPL